MPKQKQFLTQGKKKAKHGPTVPTTADEYLAAGVEFEEAGEKWRGGDAAKSTRFFVRAIDCYDEALRKFPSSFDLAYNKARVQYELTQYPKLLQQLPGTTSDLLETALESSRCALNLNPTNADVLFNTAQVLTSIAELVDSSRRLNNEEILTLLSEALDLFMRCLNVQEASYEAQMTPINDPDDMEDIEDGGVSIFNDDPEPGSSASSSVLQDDRWATIVEPITNDSLLDTVLAMLETLSTYAALLPPDHQQALQRVRDVGGQLLNEKLGSFLPDTGRDVESAVTAANFVCAHAGAEYRSSPLGTGNTAKYLQTVEDAYKDIDLSAYPKGLVEAAESYMTYNTSVRIHTQGPTTEALKLRWKALTRALDHLTVATKIPTAEHMEKIHLARGDAELSRYQLGQGKVPLETAASNSSTLLRNAEKFYRGSQALARVAGEEEVLFEGVVKEALAMTLGGQGGRLQEKRKEAEGRTMGVLVEGVEDGLVMEEQLQLMGF